MPARSPATVEDLYHVPENGKAEIVNGKLVLMSPTGYRPGRAGGAVYTSLLGHEQRTKTGFAIPDNVGFIVRLPNRLSFSPDAAFHTGEPKGLDFAEGAPVFAAEVRSKGDYGPKAERRLRAKRKDYFAAGTLVVWDVDLKGPVPVRSYRASDPSHPTLYCRGQRAEAEPAVPGWSMPVDDLFL